MNGSEDKPHDGHLKMALLQSVFVCISQEGDADVKHEGKSSQASSHETSCTTTTTTTTNAQNSERYISNITVNSDRICVVTGKSERQKIHIASESSLLTALAANSNLSERYKCFVNGKKNCTTNRTASGTEKNVGDFVTSLPPAESFASGDEIVAANALAVPDASSNLKINEVHPASTLLADDHLGNNVHDGNFQHCDSGSSDENSSSEYSEQSAGEEYNRSLLDETDSLSNDEGIQLATSHENSHSSSFEDEDSIDVPSKNLDDEQCVKQELLSSTVTSSIVCSPSKLTKSASDPIVERQRELISELNCQISARNKKPYRTSNRHSEKSSRSSSSTDVPKSFQELFTPLDESCKDEEITHCADDEIDLAPDKLVTDQLNESLNENSLPSDEEKNFALQCFVGFLIFILVLVMSDPWSCNLLFLGLCLYMCKYCMNSYVF